MNRKQLPNLLSLIRLVALPPLLCSAIATDTRSWFFGILCLAWLTDALDGFLARRLHAVSELGRMLDSWADYATLALCLAGLVWLWPEVVAREGLWIGAGVTACFAVVICGLVRHGRPPGYHTKLAKVVGVTLPPALACVLADWSAWPLRGVVLLQLLSSLEELAIFLLLPGYSGEMPSVRQAWRQHKFPPADPTPLPSGERAARQPISHDSP